MSSSNSKSIDKQAEEEKAHEIVSCRLSPSSAPTDFTGLYSIFECDAIRRASRHPSESPPCSSSRDAKKASEDEETSENADKSEISCENGNVECHRNSDSGAGSGNDTGRSQIRVRSWNQRQSR